MVRVHVAQFLFPLQDLAPTEPCTFGVGFCMRSIVDQAKQCMSPCLEDAPHAQQQKMPRFCPRMGLGAQ